MTAAPVAANPTAEYRALLEASREAGRRNARTAVARLEAATERTGRMIEFSRLGTSAMTRAEALSMRAEMVGLLSSLSQQSARITALSAGSTVSDIADLHAEAIPAMYEAAGQDPTGVAARFEAMQAQGAEMLESGDRTTTIGSLVREHYKDAASSLDAILDGAVENGVSSSRVASDIADLVAFPDTVGDLSQYGLDRSDVSGLATIKSDTQRIVVSETLNTMREATNVGATESGMVEGMQWILSGAHEVDDECDDLAEADDFGLGPGFYPPDEFPDAPHPNCACSAGDVTLLPPEDWEAPVEPEAEVPVPDEPMTDAEIMAQDSSAYPMARPGEDDTKGQFTDANGNWTPERQALHDAIARQHFEGRTGVDSPTVWVMGGGPASGKSKMINTFDLPENRIKVDPDAIKKLLPEMGEGIAAGDTEISSFVHEESSTVAKDITAEGVDGSFNILIDGTGDNTYEKLAEKVAGYRENGARVVGNYVTVDVETAMERMIKASQDPNSDRFGRAVPEDELRKVHAKISEIFPRIVENGLYDELNLYDTNGPLKLIAQYKDGEFTVLDQDAYDRFLAKATEYPPPVPPATEAAPEAAPVPEAGPPVTFASGGGTEAPISGVTFADDGTLVKGIDTTFEDAFGDKTQEGVKVNKFLAANGGGVNAEEFVRRIANVPDDWQIEVTQMAVEENNIFGQDRLHFSATFTRDGGTVGQLNRSVLSTPQGSRALDAPGVSATHGLFEVMQEARGIGKQVIQEEVALYDAMGVKEVRLVANIDVGGYAWARYGFLPDQHGWDKLRGELATTSDAGLKQILANPDPRAIRLLAEAPGGKDLLLGSEWEGTLNLADPETRRVLAAYIGR